MEITDIKKVYPEFKFFKDIYTSINKAPAVVCHVNDGKLVFEFLGMNDAEFSLVYGKFTKIQTEFLKWLVSSDCTLQLNMDDVNLLAKCLKKNIQKITYDEENFSFYFLDKEGNSNKINFTKSSPSKLEKINKINSMIKYSEELPEKFLSKDILVVYLKNNKITDDENYEKLLEIPSKKVESSLKNGKYQISYSDRIGISKYVKISCENEILRLSQIFATV